jgi:hypothetical protein
MAKTTDLNSIESIKKLNDRIAQIKAQKAEAISRLKKKERADRTRRLIQNGALAEKYLVCDDIEPEAFQTFLEALVNQPGFGDQIFAAKQTIKFEEAQTTEQITESNPDDQEQPQGELPH